MIPAADEKQPEQQAPARSAVPVQPAAAASGNGGMSPSPSARKMMEEKHSAEVVGPYARAVYHEAIEASRQT